MASFLSQLVRSDPSIYQLVDTRTGAVVARTLLVAFDSRSRRTGLLRHTHLPADEAMIIAPCNSIHTFFMKFAIDVAFVAKDGRVLKIRRRVPPWRMSAAIRAHAVIECAAGVFERVGVMPGDGLAVVRRADESQATT
jgi:uncharacterized membrane protein (UPF0127 family)